MTRACLFLLLSLSLSGCGGERESSSGPSSEVESTRGNTDPLKYVELMTPSRDVIKTSIAYKSSDQQQGLSGVRSEDFLDDEGKFFYYFSEANRTFWMPNTFFALDIFYLDEDLKIERIVRNLPSYQGSNYAEIPRAPMIRSRHVLEMKSGSSISDELKVGDQFLWESSVSLEDIGALMEANMEAPL